MYGGDFTLSYITDCLHNAESSKIFEDFVVQTSTKDKLSWVLELVEFNVPLDT